MTWYFVMPNDQGAREAHWFLTLDDARQKMEHWRRDYNEVRPHSAIGNKVPKSLLNGSGAAGPP
jgi:putative transposase